MESWVQRVFLMPNIVRTRSVIWAALVIGAVGFTPPLLAQDDDGTLAREKTVLDAVIEPDLNRREVREDKIDSENIELGFFAGVISVEDFGSNNVMGYRASYLISEDWFLEAAYGEADVGKTSAEALFGINLVGADRTLDYYNFSLGVNLFPGEIFLGTNYAFNSNVFLILGAGNTRFAGDEFFTYNFGGGFRMFITDWLAFRLDFRNHIFTHNILGEEKSIQNLETHLGLSLYF